MTDRNLDQLLGAWMDLGPTVAPDRVADAARLEARTTRQTVIPYGWPPRRIPFMNTTAKIVAAAAAVVVAAFLGYNYLVAPNIGAPTLFTDPTPDPSPQPDAAMLIAGSGALAPGAYTVTQVPPLRIKITVPEGWESNMVPAMIWSDGNSKASLGFFTVSNLFADPCDPDRSPAGIGPTADDLVAALADVPGASIDAQADVTVSGYSGTRVDFTGTPPECAEGVDAVLLQSQPGNFAGYPAGGGKLNRWYVLDIEGKPLVIHASVPQALPDSVTAEVESILESISIEGP